MRPRWVRRSVMVGLAVLCYGCSAVGAHLWTGQPWGDALLLGALLAAAWVISMEAWERRQAARKGR